MPDEIQVEGLKEFHAAVKRGEDTELPKRLGQANKRIGELVISKLSPAPDPLAVGAGTGAAVRASASKRDVILRAGGSFRDKGDAERTRMQQWGKKHVPSNGEAVPLRPYIKQTAADNADEIAEAWLVAVHDAFRPAFNE